MKNLLLIVGAGLLSLAYAGEKMGGWTEQYKPFPAAYLIYSGDPGERAAPTRNDRKLAISVKGEAARQVFASLYPDAKGVSCTAEQGERLRRKGDIWCSYRPSDGYQCFLGFNLRTGQPDSGASC